MDINSSDHLDDEDHVINESDDIHDYRAKSVISKTSGITDKWEKGTESNKSRKIKIILLIVLGVIGPIGAILILFSFVDHKKGVIDNRKDYNMFILTEGAREHNKATFKLESKLKRGNIWEENLNTLPILFKNAKIF